MIRLLLVITTLVLTQTSFGQKKNLAKGAPKPLTNKEEKIEERNHNCVKKVNKSFSARIKNYPFNNTTQVQLVSFVGGNQNIENKAEYINDSLPRQNDTICFSKLNEIRTLTITQIEKLTDILYNYEYAGPIRTMTTSLCYVPKNAILFLDKNSKVFEFIEICFECDRIKESSEEVSLSDICDQKISMVKSFFKEVGIKYGITEGLLMDN